MSASLREARIDLAALRANLSVLGPLYVVDLAGDAYGHGFDWIANAALDAGVTRFAVREEGDREALARWAADRPIQIFTASPETSSAVYGLADRPELAPVMSLAAEVISVKRLTAGEPVSYGYTWRAPRDTTVALVGIGYADGVARRASNRGTAFLHGDRPIVGRIAMDVLSLELGDDAVSIGDEAVLFGHAPGSTEVWAGVLGVPPLSVTAGIGRRVTRVIVGGGS